MKNTFVIPALLLTAILAVACGKSADSGPAPASLSGAPVAAPPPSPPAPIVTTSDLQAFCRENLGTLSADLLYCKFEQQTNLGQARLMGQWNSQVYVVKNDTVDIRHSGTPIPMVGSIDYSPGTQHFVTNYSGNLAFRGQSTFNVYSINEISVKRCFSSRSTTVACPN